MSLVSTRRAIKISTIDSVVNPTDMYKIASMVMPTSIIHPNGTGEAALAMTIMAATRARIAQVSSGPELWGERGGLATFRRKSPQGKAKCSHNVLVCVRVISDLLGWEIAARINDELARSAR